ncbi:MAG: transposase DNA-binding-containing protein [Candidatus Binatia bacterium]
MVKDIHLYPVYVEWRSVFCAEPPRIRPPRRQRVCEDWAGEAFGAAALGDERPRKRLLVLACAFYARPRAQRPQACASDRARTKAGYRKWTW